MKLIIILLEFPEMLWGGEVFEKNPFCGGGIKKVQDVDICILVTEKILSVKFE